MPAGYLTEATHPWLFKPLQRGGTTDFLQAFQVGAQMKQRGIDNALREREAETRWRAMDLEAQLKQDALDVREKKTAGYAKLSSVLGGIRDFTDPAAEQQFWSVGLEHPYMFEDMNKVYENTFVNARTIKARANAALEPPAQVQNVQWVTKFEEQAELLKDIDPVRSKAFRQQAELLKAGMLSKDESLSFTTGWDDQGRPIMRMGKGAGDLTVATQSQIQQRGLAIEKSANQAAELIAVLRPENLGVSGVMREGIGKTLGQLFPELVDKQNIDARTLLRLFNERMLPSLKADSQMNVKEEQRLGKIMVSLGAAESYENAKPVLNRLLRELREIVRTDARTAGSDIPKWAMYPDEIKDLVQEGKMPVDEARELIKRYHPSFTPQ